MIPFCFFPSSLEIIAIFIVQRGVQEPLEPSFDYAYPKFMGVPLSPGDITEETLTVSMETYQS